MAEDEHETISYVPHALRDSSSQESDQLHPGARSVLPDRYDLIQFDLISVLVVAQTLRVDFLSLGWKKNIRHKSGGQAYIKQVRITPKVTFLFKVFSKSKYGYRGTAFKEALNEMTVHYHPAVREHPNIVRIEGMTWKINRKGDFAWPVLIYEKATRGDLRDFMSTGQGRELDFEARLKLCLEVGIAIRDLQASGT